MDVLHHNKPRKTKIKDLKGKIKFLQCRFRVNADVDADISAQSCETTVTTKILLQEIESALFLEYSQSFKQSYLISPKLENLARMWRIAWRFQIFLMATDPFLFIRDVLYAHIRQHKKSCVAQTTVVSTKKMFHMKVIVAQQNYVSYKKMCCGNKKNYVTPNRRLMLSKYVQCCTEKDYVFTKNDSCCI